MHPVTNNTDPNGTGKWKSCNSAPLAINNTCSCTFEGCKLIFELTHLRIGVLVIFSSVRIAHTGFVMYPLEGHLQTIMLYLASVIQKLPEETFQQLFYNITKSLIAHYRNTYRKEVERTAARNFQDVIWGLQKIKIKIPKQPWASVFKSSNVIYITACKIFMITVFLMLDF